MFGKAFGLTKKQKKGTAQKASTSAGDSRAPIGNIAKMLNASGRIGLQTMQKLAAAYEKPGFIRFIHQPVLVGSSIKSGSLSGQKHLGNAEMNQTVIFEVDNAEGDPSDSESLKYAIYPLVKSEDTTGSPNIFSIGRVHGNDMIMPDYAISKQHAILEIKRENYLIRDCDSTNGTKINGTRVGKKRAQLKDGDILGFARYEFSFLFPESFYDMLKGSDS